MVMIICTDEFYSRSGKLVSRELSHWDGREREGAQILTVYSSPFLPHIPNEHFVIIFTM